MDILWAPWRMDYILGPKPDTCVFCLPEHRDEDAERLVLYRGQHVFVILNKFPYNSGHLMVTPLRHVMDFCDLTVDEHTELFSTAQQSVAILRQLSKPEGFNLGFNLGMPQAQVSRNTCIFILFPAGTGTRRSWLSWERSVRCRSTCMPHTPG